MGQEDIVLKEYLSRNDIFADLFNGCLFNGKEVLKPEDLEERDSTETFVMQETTAGKVKAKQESRDVIKKAAFGTEFVLLGIENQNSPHYAMAVRNMLYDAMRYKDQVEELVRSYGDRKGLKGAEFLSGMKKDDKILPVVTLVLYWGTTEWDGSLDLHSMLKFPEDEAVTAILKSCIPNYKLNFV